MHEQLLLVRTDDDQPWRLDEQTREVGRRGVQEARAALLQVVADESLPAPANPARRLPTRRRTAA